jgi:hypothetical protein
MADVATQLDQAHAEIAGLRRALADHPSAQTLRWLAPFIRAAMDADVWQGTEGPEAVRHELGTALAWLDRQEHPHPNRRPVEEATRV